MICGTCQRCSSETENYGCHHCEGEIYDLLEGALEAIKKDSNDPAAISIAKVALAAVEKIRAEQSDK